VRLIAADGVRMIAGGVVIGGVVSAVAARTLQPLLFGLTPWDTRIFAAAPIVLTVAALVATYVPARRAARLDPTDALR
jgi:ABC-type antimicrobial peptide transport system permease subunit